MLLRLIIIVALATSCESPTGDDRPDPVPFGTYFPPLTGNTWEELKPEQLGWNLTRLTELDAFLESTQTEAFVILYRGRILHERYFNGTGMQTVHPWYSAGKTVTSTLMGMAEHRGHLFVDDATSKYLGRGWTSLTPAVENHITIKHQLTMTTGLDDYPNGRTDLGNCMLPECLLYKAEPGTQIVYQGALVPPAPSDMVAALGLDDKKIYIVPSRELVIVRFGDRGGDDNPLTLSQYDRDLWALLMAVMGG